MSRKGYDLLGRRFGKLLVIQEIDPVGYRRKCLCRCDCGTVTNVFVHNLVRKKLFTKSCKRCGSLATRKRPYEAIYNRLKRVAKKINKGLLSYEEFLLFTRKNDCQYCGALVEWTKHFATTRESSRYNLDRKNNKKGYRANNLVVCCKSCNFTKGDRFTYEQFLKIGEVIRSFRCS